jgi:phosphoribosylformylglycinamidine synthase
MKKPRVLVLRTAGTNCDKETAFAFDAAGADAELVHINELTRREAPRGFNDYHILAIPGGFTYGDDIASGKILANELKFKLEDALQKFIKDGKLIIGICNGFQILVKAGLLPNLSGDLRTIEATLTLNDSNKFEDRWVYLKNSKLKTQNSKCIWTKGINKIIHLALEYCDEKGEGREYPYNPNGSVDNIAGICDPTGRIFGLMPHPERHISFYQGPHWTRVARRGSLKKEGDGFAIFTDGVKFAKKYL